MADLVTGSDDLPRCHWCVGDDLYQKYHDEEWGFAVIDDRKLFEKICLEGFQAGLSWLTILRKREHFRAAFANFDYAQIARFDDKKVKQLLNNAGIIRHEGKIRATINNAARAIELCEQAGSLAAYFWGYEPKPAKKHQIIPRYTDTSKALSRDLKRRGWSFVGATSCYAFMQAVGLVNDHYEGCWVRSKVSLARKQAELCVV